MDEKDFETAAALEQLTRDVAILNARSQAGGAPPEGFDGHCPECGVDVHEKRVALGYYLCIECAQEREFRKKMGITDA
jgi:RNA polymerase-binding transcription factor DksA